jgi:hypothetical protein
MACASSAPVDPTPVGPLPEGRLLQRSVDRIEALDATGSHRLPHGIPLGSAERTSTSVGDRVMPLAAGGFVYCGSGLEGARPVSGCWAVDPTGATRELHRSLGAARGGDPAIALHVLPDGSWWNRRTYASGPALGTPGPSLHTPDADGEVWVAPRTGRQAWAKRAPCRLEVHAPGAEMAVVRRDSCDARAHWSPDGHGLAVVRDGAVVVWRDGEERVVSPRAIGPDGHEVHTSVVDWSPSGDALLIRSSRYHRRTVDLLKHAKQPRSTYLVDVATGAWTRLAHDVGVNARWVPSRPRVEGAP